MLGYCACARFLLVFTSEQDSVFLYQGGLQIVRVLFSVGQEGNVHAGFDIRRFR